MPRKSNRNYFTETTENAIIEFNESKDRKRKRFLYETEILPAVDKLVENVIHKYKFYRYDSSYEDLKHDTVIHIHEKLNKFRRGKGKAYSYFTIVAKNYLIVRTKKTYQHQSSREELTILDEQRNIPVEVANAERQGLLESFVEEWAIWGIDNVEDLFNKKRDQKIAEAIFVIFRSCRDIDNFNKKALYILIREHADVKTQYITKVVNVLKPMFGIMCKDYLKHGIIDWDRYLLENSQ